MQVWRLYSSRYPALDGEGARLYGGRWSFPGTAIVYTSATLALAVLEILVHTDSDILPVNQTVRSADIPGELVIEKIEEDQLSPNWRDYPAPEALQALGTAWSNRGQTVVLSVPSVVIPEERNYLLNPFHADFRKIRWSEPRPFQWDPRLLNK
jgi:RES domain-containing protein